MPPNNTFTCAAPVEFRAATEEGQRPAFSIAAYTGAQVNHPSFHAPVIVDLAGLRIARQQLPILLDHDATRIVGQASEVNVDPTMGVNLSGIVTGDDSDAQKVVTHAKNGFQWQASIGFQITRREFLESGRKSRINGRDVFGPLVIARSAELKEVSFVAIGADSNTSAVVAAIYTKDKDSMEFNDWLQAKGWDGASLNDTQRVSLKKAYEAEQNPAQDTDLEAVLLAGKQDRERVATITKLTAAALGDYPARAQEIETLSRLACSAGWTTDRYELEMLRAMRTAQVQPWRNGGRSEAPSEQVIEAALALSCGIQKPERHYSEETLDAASKRYKHGIGLNEVLLIAAHGNGYTDLSTRNTKAILKAAFADGENTRFGFSTISLPNVFSNVANKISLDAFNAVENVWRRITAVRPVSDFKSITSFSLTGDLQYEKVGPAGEIPHGTLGETVYSNKAETFGKMLALTYQDLRNDDTGALNRVPQRLGRGAALKINDVFWTAFLDNSTFFTAARGNYDDGADTAFSADALILADVLFRSMTDPDGKPLATIPTILLVPTALRIAALRLMNSQMVATADDAGTSNPWAGAFRLESSTYLSNSAYTGNSAKAYYLLADPQDMPVIETCFLDGREAPMIESADANFDVLGIQMRGVHNFGVAKQEYRGGVKMKGEA
ncbi:MAG: HK97 family phage prohead protease [Planctomycetes bacterium]|nr:HK97 family phage prohead protease [Planctomycetota bacterium]